MATSRAGAPVRSTVVDLPPFQLLIDRHADEVHRFLVAAVGRQDADDCLQETVLAALRAYPRLRDGSNLRAWLFTIAHRKALDEHRARSRRPVPVEAVAGGAAPERTASEPALWRAVRALPDKQRGAVLHRYVNDLAYADVARMLGCSEEAARRSAHDGVARLRREWRP